MGGCYSSDSEKAQASPQQKQPREKHNGKGPPQYSPLTNGETNYQEDLVQANNRGPVSTEGVLPTVNSDLPEAVEEKKGVAPSDSGIESLGSPHEESIPEPVESKEFSLCKSCHQKLKRISRGSCHQCGNFRIDTSELSALVNSDTYCTCGPRELGKQSTCRTHGVRGRSALTQRHSDIPGMVLKSNLKKNGPDRSESKHVRMSWKSEDSLDLNSGMNTCMDRAKSEASEVFRDDVSFRAPLAKFDSLDNQFEDEDEDHCDAALLASRMSIYNEILDLADCICKCDFSVELSQEGSMSPTYVNGQPSIPTSSLEQPHGVHGSECRLASSQERSPLRNGQPSLAAKEEDDEDSGHGMSKSEGRSGSTSGIEELEGAEGSLSSNSSPIRYAAGGVLESLMSDHKELAYPVSVIVKGRQVVVMDASTYTQMLNDLALLKEQLSHLTKVIQEEEEAELAHLNLSLQLNE